MSDLSKVEVLVVAGGGAGGQDVAGGGGGGGVISEVSYLVIPGENIEVVVGDGGRAPTAAASQGDGGQSEEVAPPQYFDIPGEYEVTVNPGLYTVKVWGAGGGGSRGTNNTNSRGGGGACVVKTNISVSRTETWKVWVGEGGLARSVNVTELGGYGYGSGGNGALEYSAMNPDYKIAVPPPPGSTDNRSSVFLKTKEPVLVLLRNAKYLGSLTGNSIFIEEGYKYIDGKIVATGDPVNAFVDQNVSTIYFAKPASEYKIKPVGGIQVAVVNRNLETVVEFSVNGSATNLIFFDGYVQVSFTETAGRFKVSSPDNVDSFISTADGAPVAITNQSNKIVSTDFKLSGYAGGGGGGSSAIKGTSIDKTGLLVAGGGGGAGGNRSSLNQAGGGGTGTGNAGRAGPMGIEGIGTDVQSNATTVAKVGAAQLPAWLKSFGVWESIDGVIIGNYFTRTYNVNFPKSGSYTILLTSTDISSVFIDNIKVAESKFIGDPVEITVNVNQGLKKVRIVAEVTDTRCYSLDSFVRDKRKGNNAGDYLLRSRKVSLLYTTVNTPFILTNGSTRYGLGRLPDMGGLEYWVNQSFANNWSVDSSAFYDIFFAAVDQDPGESQRSKTNIKTFNAYSQSGCGVFLDGPKNAVGLNDVSTPAVGCVIRDNANTIFSTDSLPTEILGVGGGGGGGSSSEASGGGGGGGGVCQNGDGTLFVGENGKSTGDQVLPGNAADTHYRGITGRGGDNTGRAGNGSVVIVNISKSGLQVSNGKNSKFGKLTAIGGGGGAGSAGLANGGNGGSGGGVSSGRIAGLGTALQGTNGALGSTKCYDMENFVNEFKDRYDPLEFRRKALNIQDVYLSNSAYTLTNGSTRYGLFRKPDAGGLAYWTKICIDQNWSITSKSFLETFFGSVAASPDTTESSRALTSAKTFVSGSYSCTFLDRGDISNGGGGGGAAQPGQTNGTGGNGVRSEITGFAKYYGGGGGGTDSTNYPYPGGLGGGGTNGGFAAKSNHGLANTGGGGSAFSGPWGGAGNGGSGIVIVKYPAPVRATGGVITNIDGIVLHQFVSVGQHSFTVSKAESGIPPPLPLSPDDIICTGDTALSEYYAGQGIVRLGTVGFPENIRTPIPTRDVISIKNFYGAKTGEYTIVGQEPDTGANIILWEENTQGLFRITSVREAERLYYSVDTVETPTIFDPKLYPANTQPGQYTNYVKTDFNLAIVGGPYSERVRVEKSGPANTIFGNLVDEYKLDPGGNYLGPTEQFFTPGIYTYTFYFPTGYSYANGNILTWTGNFIPAPVAGTVTTQPPVLVPIPTTTTTSTTTQPPYLTQVNTFPYVGSSISLCSSATVGVRNGPPGAGMSVVITGPVGSLINSSGREEITNLNLGSAGAYTFESRQFVVPGRYQYTFNFAAASGTAFASGSPTRQLTIDVRQGVELTVASATGTTTFKPGELVKVIITGQANDIVNWTGITSGSVNLGPDAREEVTLLPTGHNITPNNYSWNFTTDNTKTCNTATFNLTLVGQTTQPPTPDPPIDDTACNTTAFNQTGSFLFLGTGPKGTLIYDQGAGIYGGFTADIGTVRGTIAPKLAASRVYGNNTFGYAEHSHWGQAAIHAGLLTNEEVGLIKVTSIGRKKSFPASTQNGVNSSNTDSTTSYCAYTLSKQSGTGRVNVCATSYVGTSLEGFNSAVNSSNIANITGSTSAAGEVFGNNTFGYSWKSDFRKAVVHAGLLADGETGDIEIEPLGNKFGFPGTRVNDVQSLGYDGDSCAVRLKKPGSIPTTQCTPIDFVNCCPLVYNSATTLAGVTVAGVQNTIVNGNTRIRGNKINGSGVVWGDNSSTGGYAWGSDISMAVVHAGVLKDGQSGNIRIINMGSKTTFGSSTANEVTSASYTTKRCAFRIELIDSEQVSNPTIDPTDPDQCMPINFSTCCPTVYNTAKMVGASYYGTNGTGPITFGANGKVTVKSLASYPSSAGGGHMIGNNTSGYLWGPKDVQGTNSGPNLSTIVCHSGLAKANKVVTVRVINAGIKTSFTGSQGRQPFGLDEATLGTGKGDWTSGTLIASTSLNKSGCAFVVRAINPTDSDYNAATDANVDWNNAKEKPPGLGTGTTDTTTKPPTTSGTTGTTKAPPKILSFRVDSTGQFYWTTEGEITALKIDIIAGTPSTDYPDARAFPVNLHSYTEPAAIQGGYSRGASLSTFTERAFEPGGRYTFKLYVEGPGGSESTSNLGPRDVRTDGTTVPSDVTWVRPGTPRYGAGGPSVNVPSITNVLYPNMGHGLKFDN